LIKYSEVARCLVSFSDLQLACEFVSSGGMGENEAYLDRQSGKIYWHFAREFLPDDYDEVRHIFSRRGAYRRYKELLVRRDALERWYDFSNKSEAAALREWCAENGIDLSGT